MAKSFNTSAIMFGIGVIIIMISLTAGAVLPQTFNITIFLIIAILGAVLSTIGLVRFIDHI